MKKRVQIVRIKAGESRWTFIAHGAPYDRDLAEKIKTDYEGRGDKIRFLPVREK